MDDFQGVRHNHARLVAIAACMIALLMSGCASLNTGDSGSDDGVNPDNNAPIYYDFGDVLVPREMKIEKNASFVFRTPGLSAGVLSMKGRVDGYSLITFFENNMANDNWSMVSAFKSFRNIMLFKKENRWCVINITEKKFYTYLEIWVSPTVEGASPNLFK
jgi:ASC-1-like (ASCH) protein